MLVSPRQNGARSAFTPVLRKKGDDAPLNTNFPPDGAGADALSALQKPATQALDKRCNSHYANWRSIRRSGSAAPHNNWSPTVPSTSKPPHVQLTQTTNRRSQRRSPPPGLIRA